MRIDLTRNDIRHIKTVSLVLLRKCDVYLLYRTTVLLSDEIF